MEFIRALKTAITKQKRKAGVRAYYSGGTVYMSRLYGYRLIDGHYSPDERFAPGIRTIFEMLTVGKSLPEIKAALDSAGMRDSSNNRYSISRIIAIAERPVYAGSLHQRGRLVKIENMTSIVAFDLWKAAQRQLKIEKKKIVDQM